MAEASAAATSSILDSLEETILSDLGIAEVTNTSEEMKSLLQSIEERVRPLRCSRGIVKRKITLLLKPFTKEPLEDDNPSLLESILEEVNLRLEEVRQYDHEIEAKICESELMKYDQNLLNEEVVKSSHYHLQLQRIIHGIRPHSNVSSKESTSPSHSQQGDNISREELQSILKRFKPQQELKIPALKCRNFSGGEDKCQFRSFILSFENVYGCRKDTSNAANCII